MNNNITAGQDILDKIKIIEIRCNFLYLCPFNRETTWSSYSDYMMASLI
ncbi:hypothetical protein CPter291_0865 [Collimonas pratensis]|uniref:Uncharacterized protein n=1 Tax=Collimonas pratensis TaxID=279113 RepID=A0A127Q0G0_9BURK|nr:hypothetical protein CPter91_0947 [Collimonas pratensis]AMP13144.1 hypothetical protein CPter291_0865 [Collimonas pratensis]